jgi:protein O-GlcNAc transferase
MGTETSLAEEGSLDSWLRQADERFTVGDLAGSEAPLRRALALAPDDATLRIALGNVLLRLGNVEGARAEFYEAVLLGPGSAPAHLNLATALSLLGRYQDSESEARRALRLDGSSVEALKMSGALALRAGNYAEGVGCYAEAVWRSPRDTDALMTLAECYAQAEDLESAVTMYARVLEIAPAHEFAVQRAAELRHRQIGAQVAASSN